MRGSTCLLLLLAGACSAPQKTNTAPERPPNIVIFLVDDLGWRDLGCTGSEFYETPHIDSLAASGLRSTAAYAACAVCSPSRAALQTGRHPTRSGITDWIRPVLWGGPVTADGRAPEGFETMGEHPLEVPRNATALPREETTIAEYLAEAGYATAHIGKWHLGAAGFTPLDRGYDLNAGGCDLGQPPSYFDPFTSARAPDGLPGLPARETGQYLTAREADAAQAFMSANRERPFFLHLASYAVHTPLQAPAELVARYRAKPLNGKSPPKNRATYAAMVECVDHAVGRVLDTIDDLGLRDNTVVIFTSDNGGHGSITDNRPLRGAKGWPYEGGVRVPLIVRWPGRIPPASLSSVPFSSIDILPTLLSVATVAPDPDTPDLDGISFFDHWQSAAETAPRPLFWHYPHYHGSGSRPNSAVRDGPWKLIRWYEGGSEELFHLGQDPGETTNLSNAAPQQAQRLGQLLDGFLRDTGARLPR